MTLTTPDSVQAAFAAMLDRCGKSQKDIALEAGFERRNVISMMKSGEMKVPIDRAPALARACGADPAAFTRLVLAEYSPAVLETLDAELGVSLSDDRPGDGAGAEPKVCSETRHDAPEVPTSQFTIHGRHSTRERFRELPERWSGTVWGRGAAAGGLAVGGSRARVGRAGARRARQLCIRARSSRTARERRCRIAAAAFFLRASDRAPPGAEIDRGRRRA